MYKLKRLLVKLYYRATDSSQGVKPIYLGYAILAGGTMFSYRLLKPQIHFVLKCLLAYMCFLLLIYAYKQLKYLVQCFMSRKNETNKPFVERRAERPYQ